MGGGRHKNKGQDKVEGWWISVGTKDIHVSLVSLEDDATKNFKVVEPSHAERERERQVTASDPSRRNSVGL